MDLEELLPNIERYFTDAKHAKDVRSGLTDFDQWLRGIDKHGNDTDRTLDVGYVREKLHDFLSTSLYE